MIDDNTAHAAKDVFDGEYEPSPVASIRDTVALYTSSGGIEGNTLEGQPVVILSTIGAKSGKVRKNPILRIQKDSVYVVAASAAGAPQHPSWYGNLIVHPEVRQQDGREVLRLRAHEIPLILLEPIAD